MRSQSAVRDKKNTGMYWIADPPAANFPCVNTVRIRKTGTSRIPGLAQACLSTPQNQKNATILQNSGVKSSFLVVSGGF